MSNTLAAMRLELIAEWSEKNNPFTPDKITFGSNRLAWWKCNYEFERTSIMQIKQVEKNNVVCAVIQSGDMVYRRPICVGCADDSKI